MNRKWMTRILTLTTALTLSASLVAAQPASPPATQTVATAVPEAATPTSFVKARASEVIEVVNRDVKLGTPEATKRVEDLRAVVRRFIDFELLAERTLGSHWKSRSDAQRAEFMALLTDMIETSYSRKLGQGRITNVDESIRYTGERIRNGRATVTATLQHEGRKHDLEIKMLQKGENWLVYDIITDDVSLEESYAESFDSIIVDKGWDGLLSKMREKLDELKKS